MVPAVYQGVAKTPSIMLARHRWRALLQLQNGPRRFSPRGRVLG